MDLAPLDDGPRLPKPLPTRLEALVCAFVFLLAPIAAISAPVAVAAAERLGDQEPSRAAPARKAVPTKAPAPGATTDPNAAPTVTSNTPTLEAPKSALPMTVAPISFDSTPSNRSVVAQPTPAKPAPTTNPKPVREDKKRRTAKTKTFVNSDGSKTTEYSSGPVHFRENATWKVIDTGLVRRPDGRVGAKANPVKSSFARYADDNELVRVTIKPGLTLSYGFPEARHVRGTERNSTMTYPNAFGDGISLELVSTPEGVKENIVVTKPTTATRWTIKYSLTGDATLRSSTRGDLEIIDKKHAVLATIPRGPVHDAAPTTGEPTRYALDTKAHTITTTVDREWLTAPDRQYPITIDPTVTTCAAPSGVPGTCSEIAGAQGAVATSVSEPATTGSNSSSWDIRTGFSCGYGKCWQDTGLVSFDLSSLLNKHITDAQLFLHNYDSQTTTPIDTGAYRITQGWNENAIARPAYDPTPVDVNAKTAGPIASGSGRSNPNGCPHPLSLDRSPCGIWLGWRVTKTVQQWVRGEAPNWGFAIAPTAANRARLDSRKNFDSDDAPANQPTLQVTWNDLDATYAPASSQLTVPLNNTDGFRRIRVTNRSAVDWDTTNFKLSYWLRTPNGTVVTNSTQSKATPLPQPVPKGTWLEFDATIGALAPGTWSVTWDMLYQGQPFTTKYFVPGYEESFTVPNLTPVLEAAGPDNGTIYTTTPTLSVKARDPDNSSPLKYEFRLCQDSELWIFQADPTTAPGSCSIQSGETDGVWTVPDQVMSWNTLHYWNVRAYEANNPSSYTQFTSPGMLFTQVPVAKPEVGFGGAEGDVGGVSPLRLNYSRAETDISIPSPGPAPAITRTFNSQAANPPDGRDPYGGAFGIGWMSGIDVRLIDEPSTNTKLVQYANGRRVRFGRNGSTNAFQSSLSERSVLSQNPTDSTYTLTADGSTSYKFTSNGTLTSMVDADGTVLNITPSASTTRMENSRTAKGLTLTWTGTPGADGSVVTKVESDPLAGGARQTFDYTYETSSDGRKRLTKVCGPSTDVCTTYTWADKSVKLRATNPLAGALFSTSSVGYDPGCKDPRAAGGPPITECRTFTGQAGQRAIANSGVVAPVGDLTASAWIKPSANSDLNTILFHGGPYGDDPNHTTLGFRTQNGKLVYYHGGLLNYTTIRCDAAPCAISLNTWTYVAVVRRGLKVEFYVNGALAQSSDLDPANTPVAPRADIPLTVGAVLPENPQTFNGTIAQPAVYDTAFTAAQVKNEYDAGRGFTSRRVLAGVNAAVDETINYAPDGRVSSRLDGTNATWAYKSAVDAQGSGTVTITDPDGATNEIEYDKERTVRKRDELGRESRYTYDAAGNLTIQRDPGGVVTVNTYDDFGVKTSTIRRQVGLDEAVLADKPIGYWRMNEKSGTTLADSSGNNWPLTMTNEAGIRSQWDVVPAGAEYGGDDTGLWVRSADKNFANTQAKAVTNNGFTLETWVRRRYWSSEGSFTPVLTLVREGVPYMSVNVSGSRVQAIFRNASTCTPYVGIGVDPLGAETNSDGYDGWLRVVVRLTATGTATLWAGDNSSGEIANCGQWPTASANWQLQVGSAELAKLDLAQTTTFLNAPPRQMDEIALYNSALSDAQIQRHFDVAQKVPALWTAAAITTDDRADHPRLSTVVDQEWKTTYGYDDKWRVKTVARTVRTETPKPAGNSSTDPTDEAFFYTLGTEDADAAVGGGKQPRGLLRSKTDRRGGTWTYNYDKNGWLTREQDPSGRVTQRRYDTLGRVVQQWDDNLCPQTPSANDSCKTITSYKGNGGVDTVLEPQFTDAVSNVAHRKKTVFTYDSDRRVIQQDVSDAMGNDKVPGSNPPVPLVRTTKSTYDATGKVATVTDPENRVTTTTHDTYGNVTYTKGADGTETTFEYWPDHQLKQKTLKNFVANPAGPTTPKDLILESRTYDEGGRTATISDANGNTRFYFYNRAGLLSREVLSAVTDASSAQQTGATLKSYTYDNAGRVASETDGTGKATEYAYDYAGRIASKIVDPKTPSDLAHLNLTTEFTYNGDGQVTSERVSYGTAGSGESTDTTYDLLGRIKLITRKKDESGSLTHGYTYDLQGNALEETDEAKSVTTRSYDAAGHLYKEQAPAVDVTELNSYQPGARPSKTISFNTFGDAIATKDARGNVSTVEVDRLGRPTKQCKPPYTPTPGGSALVSCTSTAYDGAGNPKKVTDAAGNATVQYFDRLGRLTQRDLPAVSGMGKVKEVITYDNNGNKISSGRQTNDPESPIDLGGTFTTYDELNRPIVSKVRENRWTEQAHAVDDFKIYTTQRMFYDLAGNRIRVESPSMTTFGQWDATVMEYDAAGRMRAQTDPLGKRTELAYDSGGRIVTTIRPSKNRTQNVYDTGGYLVEVREQDESGNDLATTKVTHDGMGRITSATTPMGKKSTYNYDAMGRLINQVEPVDATTTRTTSFGYDANGNRTTLLDANVRTFYTTYTPWNQVKDEIEPVTKLSTPTVTASACRTWTTTYDVRGLPATQTSPDKDCATNSASRITRSWSYDEAGNLRSDVASGPTSGSGVTRTSRNYSYNFNNLPISISAGSNATNLDYDDRGNVISSTSSGVTTSFKYNGLGQKYSQSDPKTGATSYTYNARGDLASVSNTAPGATSAGITTGFSYTDDGQLNDQSFGSSPVKRTYSYDQRGRLASENIATANNQTIYAGLSYRYDADSRTTARTISGTNVAGVGTWNYTYDDASRLTSETAPGAPKKIYSYDNAGNRTSASTDLATTDPKYESTITTFDERNRIDTVTTKKNGSSDVVTKYTWSPAGMLMNTTSAGTTRIFTWDALGEMTSDGAMSYSYDGTGRLATSGTATLAYSGTDREPSSRSAASVAGYVRTPSGALVGQRSTSDQFMVTNRHGDLVASVNTNGTIDKTNAYDAWGNQNTSTVDASGKTVDASGKNITSPPVDSKLGFQGQVVGMSNAVHMDARWYDPKTGTFMSRDTITVPAKNAASPNRYAYADANPITYADPTGHAPCRTRNDTCLQRANGRFENCFNATADPRNAQDCVAIYRDEMAKAYGYGNQRVRPPDAEGWRQVIGIAGGFCSGDGGQASGWKDMVAAPFGFAGNVIFVAKPALSLPVAAARAATAAQSGIGGVHSGLSGGSTGDVAVASVVGAIPFAGSATCAVKAMELADAHGIYDRQVAIDRAIRFYDRDPSAECRRVRESFGIRALRIGWSPSLLSIGWWSPGYTYQDITCPDP
ncbi:MAG: LamG-like jellyroll fold domain-containing protein, partial [Acidimicrobiia bacterium]